jgi:glucokinase
MFLAIEIGGTKLQLALGEADGTLSSLWRGSVVAAEGGEGIRRAIVAAVPELLATAGVDRTHLRAVGVGFGGPTDDATQSVIKSHHIDGWTDFPLAAWLTESLQLPTVICNDADVACLGEALHGGGTGYSPVFYITVGTGIGGGLVIDGEIYRGCGRGATEIGHLIVRGEDILESFAAGWGIEARVKADPRLNASIRTVKELAVLARAGNAPAREHIDTAVSALAEGIQQMIKLLCPRRIVIGGGVSLMGDDLFFDPLRRLLAAREFPPFAGLTEVVPAALGEEVVLHGALALAKRAFGR